VIQHYRHISWVGETAIVFWYDDDGTFHRHELTAEQSEELSALQSRHESAEQALVKQFVG
jgi:hypothetical protein